MGVGIAAGSAVTAWLIAVIEGLVEDEECGLGWRLLKIGMRSLFDWKGAAISMDTVHLHSPSVRLQVTHLFLALKLEHPTPRRHFPTSQASWDCSKRLTAHISSPKTWAED